MNKDIRLFCLFASVSLLISCSGEKSDAPELDSGTAPQTDSADEGSGVTTIQRLKLWCDPYVPAGYVELDENLRAKVDKYENVIVIPATEDQITEQKRECLHQRIVSGREPFSRHGPDAGEGGDDGAATAPETPAEVVLIAPPDGTAYADPDHDMWFGMNWQPVAGASHMLCISGDPSDCPDDIRRAALSGSVDPNFDFYSEQVTGDNAVRRMPQFCYELESCYWSVAACNALPGGWSWECEYAPFREVRVLTD